MPTKKATPHRRPHHREDESYHAAERSYATAMTLFTRQNWARARDAFQAFLKDHADNREFTDMVDRARTHLRLCERKLAPPAPDPVTADGWLLRGIVLANSGQTDDALASLDRALEGGAPTGRIHYVRAAALALAERNDEALVDLQKAIEADDNNRFHSLADPDFENLRETAGYVALVEPPRSYDADEFDDDIEDEDAEDDSNQFFEGEHDGATPGHE